MNYLFFDIECADGRKAICEFGYVLCNDKFQIIEQDNFVMNPEAEFKLTGRKGQKDLVLSYSVEEYKNSPNFKYYYEKIYNLLTDKNNKILGFGANNDILFLTLDCNRYKMDKIPFTSFDVQTLINVLYKEYTSLDNSFEKYVKSDQKDNFILHRASHDSMKTMLLFKSLSELNKDSSPSFEDALNWTKKEALSYWRDYKERRKERYKNRAINKKNESRQKILAYMFA